MKKLSLTKEFQDQIRLLEESKQTAFDMLLQVYKSEREYDSNELANRIQAQQFINDPRLDNLMGEFGWNNKEYYEPNSINNSIAPIIQNKFSSYAAIHNNNDEITIPLVDSFIVNNSIFDNSSFGVNDLSKYQSQLKNKFNIRFIDGEMLSKFSYKKQILKNGLSMIKNSVIKNNVSDEQQFAMSGTITVQKMSHNGILSNMDKLTKINDYVLKNIVNKYSSDIGIKKESVKFASRIFAHILLSRALDLGDVSNNKELEKCMWLQFSSVLNKYHFNSSELKLITKIGMVSAVEMCKAYEISYKKVVLKSLNLGYKYEYTPTNYEEAFCVNSSNLIQLDNLDFKENSITLKFATPVEDTITEEQNNSTDLDNQEKREQDNSTDLDNQEKREENNSIHLQPQRKIEENQNDNSKKSFDGERGFAVTKQIMSRGTIRKATITKIVDNIITKFLSDKATSLADNLNKRKVKNEKYKTISAELNVYNLVLSYYIKTTNSKNYILQKENNYTKSEITKSKIISQLLFDARNKFADFALEHEKENILQENTAFLNSLSRKQFGGTIRESFTSLIKFYVKLCTAKDFESAYSQKPENMQKTYVLNQGMKYLEASKNNGLSADEIDLLNGDVDYSENIEEKSPVRNDKGQIIGDGFVIVDEGTQVSGVHKPNFVVVNDKKSHPHEDLTR